VERIAMPQLGETVTEGTITRWIKQPGDRVEIDDSLFEVSTEKVDTEVPSAFAGYLRQVLVEEGETAPVGALLATITDGPDDPIDDAAPPVAAPAPAAAPDAVAEPTAERPPVRPDPAPVRTARGDGFLSPAVRGLLADHGLGETDIVGSGRDGRVTRNDVLAAAANRARNGSAAAPAGGPPSRALPPAEAGEGDDVVELNRGRRSTAANMLQSIATSAHTLVVTEVDYHGLEPVRVAAHLSYLPFVARAVIDAIAEFPHVNASVGDDELIVHPRVNLGIAVDVDFEALVVPVVTDAGALRLPALAAEIADRARRAKAHRTDPQHLSGGTFTITNVGAYGTVVTAPIINQPQVAILSTDAVRMRPVAVPAGDGWGIAVHPTGNLSLSFDHRAFDGAYAAAFLSRVREILETRDWTAEVAP
jgi:2-oxoglutarate dehydrogenase E2 component (dihydrolipoamide succinyltransferase)